MVYCVLVRLLQRVHSVCTTQLAIFAICFYLFSKYIIKYLAHSWNTSLPQEPALGCGKTVRGFTKNDWNKKRQVKWTEAKCVFLCFCFPFICFFLIIHLSILFFILYYFTFYPWIFRLSMCIRTVRAGCHAPDCTPVLKRCIRASSSGSRLF